MSNGSSVLDESASVLFAYAAPEIERSKVLLEGFMHACGDSALEMRRAATKGGASKRRGVLGTGKVVSIAIERRHGTAQVAAGEVGIIRQVKPRREHVQGAK